MPGTPQSRSPQPWMPARQPRRRRMPLRAAALALALGVVGATVIWTDALGVGTRFENPVHPPTAPPPARPSVPTVVVTPRPTLPATPAPPPSLLPSDAAAAPTTAPTDTPRPTPARA